MYVPWYVSPVERKRKVILLFFKKVIKHILKCKLQITYINNISQDLCYQIPLNTTNAIDYCVMLTIHESNVPLPDTRHQFRMMCDKNILQLFFKDLN
jgi:hypothetical protein